MPKLSVIMPVFNLIDAGRKETFRQAVNSLHDQTLAGIEHIIVDGASTDGTLDLIDELVAGRTDTTIISEPDNGLYDAMNKGAAAASGKYLIFLNSDDYYHKRGGLEATYQALERHGADYSYGSVRVLAPDGTQKDTRSLPLKYILSRMPFCHMTMMARRSLFLSLGCFDTKFSICADYDLVFRMIISGAYGLRVEPVFCTFRQGGVSSIPTVIEADSLMVRKHNFRKFTNISADTIDAAVSHDRVPIKVSSTILCTPGTPPDLRRAARREWIRSLRKSIIVVHTGTNYTLEIFGHKVI